jgi:hypothetical protein
MNYKLKDIVHERGAHWVLRLPNGHYEVYKTGITHSTRCAYIGWEGDKGLQRAIAEVERREATA